MLTFVVVKAIEWRNNKELHRRPTLHKKGRVSRAATSAFFFFFKKQEAR